MPRTTKSATLSGVVGRHLRARRNELGLSQASLADRLSVSTTYVQNLEAGRCNVTVGQLERVSIALEAYPEITLRAMTPVPVPEPPVPV